MKPHSLTHSSNQSGPGGFGPRAKAIEMEMVRRGAVQIFGTLAGITEAARVREFFINLGLRGF